MVSYGGHGGGKGRKALEVVLEGLKMQVAGGVEITLPVREGFVLGEKEGWEVPQVPEGMKGKWREMGVEKEVLRAWGEICDLLEGIVR